MTDKFLQTVKEYGLIKAQDKVVVAVSGGADSMCLLHLLKSQEKALDITVTAAHLNHMLRGEESDRDEAFVIEYCEKNGIPVTTQRRDIMKLRKKGEGVEEAARRIRYEFLQNVAENSKIATAHTLSDSVETVLLNIVRGTTLSGLCGITPKRDNIIRPIISFTRQMTEEYCKNEGIDFVVDSTNLEDICRRNEIRHNVIPVLAQMNPAFYDSVFKMIQSNIKENAFLDDMANRLLEEAKTDNGYDCEILSKADEVILNRAAKSILTEYNASVQYNFIKLVKGVIIEGTYAQISPNIYFRRRRGILEAYVPKKTNGFFQKISEYTDLGEKIVECKKITLENYLNQLKVNKMLAKQAVDFDKISSDAVFRSKIAGDSIKLKNRPTKSIKKLFNEYAILPESRNSLAVLSDSFGVRWLEGFGADESAQVSDTTSTVLIITVNNKSKGV